MNFFQFTLIALIRFYRWVLSPAKAAFFGPLGRCRYTPTCSAYALEAVQTHGAAAGGWLAVKRLARCHPWGGCGPDPVPARTMFPSRQRSLDSHPHSPARVAAHAATNDQSFRFNG